MLTKAKTCPFIFLLLLLHVPGMTPPSQNSLSEDLQVELKTSVISEEPLSSPQQANGSEHFLEFSDEKSKYSAFLQFSDTKPKSLQFLLVTAFSEYLTHSGKVWVVPQTRLFDKYVLVEGLDRPTGICYDPYNEFLYVVDGAHIYQYPTYKTRYEFIILDRTFTEIYEGKKASDCQTDVYGNLYFLSSNQLNMVAYLDLYLGFKNKYYTVYSGEEFSDSESIDLSQETIFYVRNNTLNIAKARTNVRTDKIESFETGRAWGVVAVDDEVLVSLDNGEIWALDHTNLSWNLKSRLFEQPRGACYADQTVYVADLSLGGVYSLDDSDPVVTIPNAYNVECVTDASIFLVLTGVLYMLIII